MALTRHLRRIMAVNYDRMRTNQRDITTAQHFVRHCPNTRRELYYIVMEEQRGNYDRKKLRSVQARTLFCSQLENNFMLCMFK